MEADGFRTSFCAFQVLKANLVEFQIDPGNAEERRDLEEPASGESGKSP
jgi:hypothetical protein